MKLQVFGLVSTESSFDFFNMEEERCGVETAPFLVEKWNLTVARSDAIKREVRVC